jgi:hypothetical protein
MAIDAVSTARYRFPMLIIDLADDINSWNALGMLCARGYSMMIGDAEKNFPLESESSLAISSRLPRLE